MKKLLFNFLITCGIISFLACINTTYSRDDEIEITGELAHLILGEFPHHGDSFYENEIKKHHDLIDTEDSNFESRNDLASAYLKLKKWKLAEKNFLINEKQFPDKYKTASNLGVLYKKMGNYQNASKHLEKALKIKPGGHMGLGDYYLRMINWLKYNKNTTLNQKNNNKKKDEAGYVPDKNFLGTPYKSGSKLAASVANREYVITLVKNDYHFPDVYVLLGDILMEEQNYQLAIRSYYRAINLNHPNQNIIHDRIEKIIVHWRNKKEPGYISEPLYLIRNQVNREINKAENWLKQYQAVEKLRLLQLRDVSFKTMKSVSSDYKLVHQKVLEAGYYKGKKSERTMIAEEKQKLAKLETNIKASTSTWPTILLASLVYFTLCFTAYIFLKKQKIPERSLRKIQNRKRLKETV